MIYVCDSCGDLSETTVAVPEGDEWTCYGCGSHSAWEFSLKNRDHAIAQMRHIRRVLGEGGIFRPAVQR